eukprot:TRINITY_DN22478_c0_g1_i1.p1 TRINITY_DN22478_c0_g1~~TRINITY_DN22478_c0_g1_i1.p1  ORF type:complete len:666 (+),score=112.33 TRINITY_DN22478_c0_g1_i1:64-1998(+)
MAETMAINTDGKSAVGISIQWKGLSYSIFDKKSKGQRKWILSPQSGQVNPGDLVAFMGPSGAGKTSLLNGLAERLPITKGAEFAGCVEVNGVPKAKLPCPFADFSAFVEQEDALYALSTVQETLDFVARLRLPRQTTAKERDGRIEDSLKHLGLLHVQHTNVGGSSFNGTLRGLSGGERKRLSIAIELLHNPRVLFLDEPTTGLDSYQALNVMEKLRALADEGHTVVASIHQPRSSIFAMLTGLYLVAAGRPVYAGSTDTVVEYFSSQGFNLPPKFNPADFLIDLVSIDQRDPEAQERTKAQLDLLHEAWVRQKKLVVDVQESLSSDADAQARSILNARPATPAGRTFSVMPFLLLVRRGWREQMRDRMAVAVKITFNAFFTMVFGFVYFQLGKTQKSIQDRIGLLFFLSMNQAFGSVIGCSQVIPKQLVVVNRERANRLYAVIHFYFSSLCVMLPIELVPQLVNNVIIFFMTNLSGSFFVFFGIMALENFVGISLGMMLSAGFKNVQMASQLAPAVVILFLMFSGFLINEDSVPVYFIWLQEISFIRFAFKAAAVNEFEDLALECSDEDASCVSNGSMVLAQLGFDGDGVVRRSVIILLCLFVALNVLAFAILSYRRPRFLSLKENEPAAEVAADKAEENSTV